MRERPILFKGDMVRAILAGTKTQTRRPVKLKVGNDNRFDIPGKRTVMNINDPRAVEFCPFGQPGDRLWVRETWHSERATHPVFAFYRADGDDGKLIWRPSIHMPRWACRLVLEIVSVRVECVGDITEADAKAEGFYNRLVFLAEFGRIYGLRGRATHWVWVVEFKPTEVAAQGLTMPKGSSPIETDGCAS